jgi:putative acetyltransferase
LRYVLEIRIDDLSRPEIVRFLEDHARDMDSVSPPESNHHLDLEGLKKGVERIPANARYYLH